MKRLRLFILCLVACVCHAPGRAEARARANGAAAPVLKIVGASDAEGVKLNSHVTDFEHTFVVESTSAKPVAALWVSVSPLSAPDGSQVEVKCVINQAPCLSAPVAVPALAPIQVKLNADLTQEGVYTGAITLIYAGKRETTKLSVTRSRPLLPAEVLGLGVARASEVGGEPSVWLTVNGTSGREVSLNPPVVTSLVLSGPNGSKVQARVDSVKVTDEEGVTFTKPWILRPGKNSRFKLTIGGLDESGEYTGNVRLLAPDMQPVDKPFTILVGSSWLVAALFIGLGVGLGALLRRYATRDRPRILQERRILTLLSEVDAVERELVTLEEAEKNVLQTFRRRLNEQYEEVAFGTAASADAVLDDLNQKLTTVRAWVNARRRVSDIRPAALGDPFRQRLVRVEQYLLGEQADAQAADAAKEALTGIGEDIERALREDLAGRLKGFRAEVESFRRSMAEGSVVNALREIVGAKIDEAGRALEAGTLREAQQAFNAARGAYARLLADDLESRLKAVAAAPLGFDADSWSRLQTRMSEELAIVRGHEDAESSIAAYQSAFGFYLLTLLTALRRRAQQYVTLITQDKGRMTEAQFNDFSSRLAAASARVDESVRQVNAKKFPAAAAGYDEAAKAVNEVADALRAGGLMGQAVNQQQAAAAAASQPGFVPEATGEARTPGVLPREPRARTTVEELEARLRRNDILATLGVAVIAVGLGLQLLWADNAVWGTWRDRLTAVLWGLGLHQASGVAFEGLLGLKDKLSGVMQRSTGGERNGSG